MNKIEKYWKEEAILYDDFYTSKKKFSLKYYLTIFQKDRMKKILPLLKIKKGDNVLDVGCGSGHYLVLMAKTGANITGLDYSEQMLSMSKKLLEKNNIKNYELIQANALNIPKEKETYNFILSTGLLDYIEDVNKAIEEMSRVIKEGGKLLVCVPSKFSPFFLFRTKIGNIFRRKLMNAPPILSSFTKKQFKEMLEKNAFQVDKIDHVHYTMWIFLATKLKLNNNEK